MHSIIQVFFLHLHRSFFLCFPSLVTMVTERLLILPGAEDLKPHLHFLEMVLSPAPWLSLCLSGLFFCCCRFLLQILSNFIFFCRSKWAQIVKVVKHDSDNNESGLCEAGSPVTPYYNPRR